MSKKKHKDKDYRYSIDRILNRWEYYKMRRLFFNNGKRKPIPTKDERGRFSCDIENAPIYSSESDSFRVISRGSLNWNPYSKSSRYEERIY